MAIVIGLACYGGLPSDLRGLIAVMESSDLGVQAAAAERIDQSFGLQGLLVAVREGGPGARAQAARRLSRFNDSEVVRALMQVAKSDSDQQARYAAIRALGSIGDPQSVVLLNALKEDNDALIREGVQEALRAIDSDRAK